MEAGVYRHLGRAQPPDEQALQALACAFRNGFTINSELILAALDEDPTNDRPPELGLADSLWIKIRKALLK